MVHLVTLIHILISMFENVIKGLERGYKDELSHLNTVLLKSARILGRFKEA